MNPPTATYGYVPPPDTARPGVILRPLRTFNCEGVTFREGVPVSGESDLVRRVVKEFPRLFRVGAVPTDP